MRTPERLVVAITGLGQALQPKEKVGLEKLLKRCSTEIPETWTALFRWNHNVADLTRRLLRFRCHWPAAPAYLVGFSYGGMTAATVSRKLYSQGVFTKGLFLVDAVWRPWQYRPSLLSTRGRGKLKISAGVNNLYTWRQDETYLRGAEIVLDDRDMTDWFVNRWIEDVAHTEIDSLQEIHNSIISEIKND